MKQWGLVVAVLAVFALWVAQEDDSVRRDFEQTRRSQRLPPDREAVERARAAPLTEHERFERMLWRDRPVSVKEWQGCGGWSRFLQIYAKLEKPEDPCEQLAWIETAFADSERPVVRQNFVFLAVLTLPTDVAHPCPDPSW